MPDLSWNLKWVFLSVLWSSVSGANLEDWGGCIQFDVCRIPIQSLERTVTKGTPCMVSISESILATALWIYRVHDFRSLSVQKQSRVVLCWVIHILYIAGIYGLYLLLYFITNYILGQFHYKFRSIPIVLP